MKKLLRPFLLGVAPALAGCATERASKAPPFTGDLLIDGRNAIQFGPPENKVLS